MQEEIFDKWNTFLAFKGEPRDIYKIASEIEAVAKKSDCFIGDEIAIEVNKFLSSDTNRWFVDRISIKLPLLERSHDRRSETFPEFNKRNDSEKGANRIDFSFKRYWDFDVPLQDYWYLHIIGVETCSKNHFHFSLNTNYYDQCSCPEYYKKFCKELGSIIKQYPIKNQNFIFG